MMIRNCGFAFVCKFFMTFLTHAFILLDVSSI